MLIGWEVTANEDDSAAEAQIAYRRATAKQFDLGAILVNHHFAIKKLSKVPLKTLQDALRSTRRPRMVPRAVQRPEIARIAR